MALKDFNINPYYDDFDEAKKFLRILFRPGYAVCCQFTFHKCNLHLTIFEAPRLANNAFLPGL